MIAKCVASSAEGPDALGKVIELVAELFHGRAASERLVHVEDDCLVAVDDEVDPAEIDFQPRTRLSYCGRNLDARRHRARIRELDDGLARSDAPGVAPVAKEAPVTNEIEIVLALRKAEERESLRRENRALKEQIQKESQFESILAKSHAMAEIFRTILYPTPNAAARALMPASYRDDPVIFPPQAELARCEYGVYEGARTQQMFEEAMTRIRAA